VLVGSEALSGSQRIEYRWEIDAIMIERSLLRGSSHHPGSGERESCTERGCEKLCRVSSSVGSGGAPLFP
jgi:hypothetical protein